MIGQATLKYLDKTLEQDLKTELRLQGHYLTGELERSINSTETLLANGVTLDVLAADYINALETGIPASEIKFTPEYVAGILRYTQLRFKVSGAAAVKIANAIMDAHKREGMPTHQSLAFSETGTRIHVLEETYNGHEEFYNQLVEDSLSFEIDEAIDKTFTITEF